MDKNRLNSILLEACERSDLINFGKHAAAILYKGSVLAIGNNKRKSHPIMCSINKASKKIYLHAEVDAIVKTINAHGIEIFPETTLYVLRVTKGGRVTCSEPCSICKDIIESVGIKQVFWT